MAVGWNSSCQFFIGLTRTCATSCLTEVSSAPLSIIGGGQFDVEQRLGCLCCPLIGNKKRLNQFREYPKMVIFYIHALQLFRDSHRESDSCKNFNSAYEQFVRDVFYSKSINWDAHKHGIFADPDFDYKAFLEDYFKIKL